MHIYMYMVCYSSVYDCVVFNRYINLCPFFECLCVRMCVYTWASVVHPLARVAVSDASFVYLQSVSTCSYMLAT